MSRRLATLRAARVIGSTLRAVAGLLWLRLFAWTLSDGVDEAADRIGQRWARSLRTHIGLRIWVEGRPPTGPVAIVANHLSYLDIVVLWCIVPGVFVARADVADWPLVGRGGRLIGTSFIDRTRKRDLLRVIPELSEALAAGRNVIFFPEGTSSSGETVLPFRSPLFEAAARRGVPVVGVSLQYETPASAPPAGTSVCWWGDMTFLRHVFALLAIPRIEARIRFETPIEPLRDRKRLCRHAREAVVKKFIPTTALGFGDGIAVGGEVGGRGEAR